MPNGKKFSNRIKYNLTYSNLAVLAKFRIIPTHLTSLPCYNAIAIKVENKCQLNPSTTAFNS